MSDSHLSSTPFSSLDLPAQLLRALADCRFTFCTEIQALALPPLLQGSDIAGQAQTGTGKTAAFYWRPTPTSTSIRRPARVRLLNRAR